MIAGAVTMIGITALQDARATALYVLEAAACVHSDALAGRCYEPANVRNQERYARAVAELASAAREFAAADHALELAATAARAATPQTSCSHLASSDTPAPNLGTEPCRRCGLYFVDDDHEVAGGAW